MAVWIHLSIYYQEIFAFYIEAEWTTEWKNEKKKSKNVPLKHPNLTTYENYKIKVNAMYRLVVSFWSYMAVAKPNDLLVWNQTARLLQQR